MATTAEYGFEVFAPHGTYFVTTDIAALGAPDGLAFCRGLPERCGVVAVPNMVFYDDVQAGNNHEALLYTLLLSAVAFFLLGAVGLAQSRLATTRGSR